MGFGRIMSNGVMGLNAQNQALNTISQNIANSTTVGFKRSETQFQDFVVNDRYGVRNDGAGVRANDRLLADRQGDVTSTGIATNVAIKGNAFFLVQELDSRTGEAVFGSDTAGTSDRVPELTRSGDFHVDAFGHLVNNAGRGLMGISLDPAHGTPTGPLKTTDLQVISVSDGNMPAYFEATKTISLGANLPDDQAVATAPNDLNTVTLGVKAVDTTGREASISLDFMKVRSGDDGSATWQVFQSGGTYTDDGKAINDVSHAYPDTWQSLGTIEIGPNKFLAGEDGAAVTLNLNPGGAFQDMTLNLGTVGSPYNSITSAPEWSFGGISTSQDGITKGSYKDMEITDSGVVQGVFGNGQKRGFYQIVSGTVNNINGLEEVSGTTFRATDESGNVIVKAFGANPNSVDNPTSMVNNASNPDIPTTGSFLVANSVENSNTDISNEFVNLIQTQRVYSASSKIITTADEMTQNVIGIKN